MQNEVSENQDPPEGVDCNDGADFGWRCG
jgi:hypothetical protein